MYTAQYGALEDYSTPTSDRVSCAADFYSTTRELVRSGLSLDDGLLMFSDSPYQLVPLPVFEQEKPLWEDPPKSLLDWTAFLCDQGIRFDGTRSKMLEIHILSLHSLMSDSILDETAARDFTNTIFLMCLLKADVSLRDEATGRQALHVLTSVEWSAKFSPHFINIAYILIHFGGADVHAIDYHKLSPTVYACLRGWRNEWRIVLDRCGFDCKEVIRKDIDFVKKNQFLGNGESTAIDTKDLSTLTSDTATTRRRHVVGDRLGD